MALARVVLPPAVGAGDDHKLVVLNGEGDVVEDAQLLAFLSLHLIAEMTDLQHSLSLLCKWFIP